MWTKMQKETKRCEEELNEAICEEKANKNEEIQKKVEHVH